MTQVSFGAAVTRRLGWGWRTHFRGGCLPRQRAGGSVLPWLLAEGFILMSLSLSCLNVTAWLLQSKRSEEEGRRKEEREGDRQTDRHRNVMVREWRVSSTVDLLFSNLIREVAHSPCHRLCVDCTDQPWYDVEGTIQWCEYQKGRALGATLGACDHTH